MDVNLSIAFNIEYNPKYQESCTLSSFHLYQVHKKITVTQIRHFFQFVAYLGQYKNARMDEISENDNTKQLLAGMDKKKATLSR